MSTHRKIEHALFILGIIGVLLTWLSESGLKINLALFAVVAVFAGLHSFKLFDGLRANRMVIGASAIGVLFNLYVLLGSVAFFMESGAVALVVFVLVLGLSLRLHKDFTQPVV